jgi:PAS domain S-box-containing protein
MQEYIFKQGLLANPIVAVEISDGKGRITETNSFYQDLVGYDEAELSSMSVGDLCHDADRESELHERRRLLAGELEHLTFRKRYLTKSGKIIWGNTTITVVRDAAGDCEAFVAMMIDATVQHRQDQLQAGRTRVLELLYRNRSMEEVCTAIVESIESVEEGLFCSILRLNPVTGRLHKVAAPNLPDFYNDAIEGMKIGEGVGSCGAAAHFGHRVVVADILNHKYWQRARRLIEKTQLRSCWSQPIFDNNDNVLGTFAIYYTEPREPGPLELELIDSAADLTALAINHKLAQAAIQKSDQLKTEFITIAAHELNTPLASIRGYVDLLSHAEEFGPFSAEKSREFLNVIDGKVDMLSRIVNDLLDVSKIEGDYSLPVEKKPTSIRTLLTQVVSHFEQCSSRHTFSLRVDDATPEMLSVDEGRVTQLFENLVGNAVKYSPDGGAIELETIAKSDCLLIIVTDQGIGMTADQLERIFEKFYRADTGDTSIRGFGLGMSIVQEIIKAHGGGIVIESVAGKGTRIELSLPFV